MNLRICTIGLAATLVANAALAATYTSYSWKADASGGYDGVFSDDEHWNPSIADGPGSGYPESGNINQKALFPRVDADYTVTLPEGVITNAASFEMKAQYGHTVTIDGSKTTWVMPELSSDAVYGDFAFRSGNVKTTGPADGGTFVTRSLGANTAAALGTFRNFKVKLSSGLPEAPGTKLDVQGDVDWTGGAMRLFADSTPDVDGRVEIAFRDGYMPKLPILHFGFANLTNVLTFSNYSTCVDNGDAWQPWVGCLGNDVKGLFEVNVVNGSVLTNSYFLNGSYSFGYSYSGQAKYSTNKVFRVNVKDGSTFQTGQFSFNCSGRYVINVEGPGSKFLSTHTTLQNNFSACGCSTSTVSVVDGAVFQSACGVMLGAATAADAATSLCDFTISNSTASFRRGFTVNSGTAAFVDGADVTFYGSETDSSFKGGAGDSTLLADGATFHLQNTKPTTFVNDFTRAKLGPKGLVLSSEYNLARSIPQPFEDLGTDGGRLVVCSRANYPITLNNATDSTESDLVIAREKVILAAGSHHKSFVTVTNDATYSVQGDTEVTGLALGDEASFGMLELANGAVVTVSGDTIDFVNPKISFGSDLALGARTVFRFTTQPTAATVEYWEAFAKPCVEGIPDSLYGVLEVVEDDGAWLFNIRIVSERPDLTGDTTWTGPGATWDDASWGGTSPSGALRATFGGAEPKDVTVEGTVDAGAIRFTEGDYTVSGGAIRLSDNVSVAIESEKGENEVASALRMASPVTVEVDADTLALSGAVTGGGFVKTGEGRLEVSGANRLPYGLSLAGGTLAVLNPAAFGYLSDNTLSTLRDGTLAFEEVGGATKALTQIEGPVVYKPEVDVTMPLPTATAGAIFKRGAGSLVFEAKGDTNLPLTPSDGFTTYAKGDEIVYPADGTVPADHYALTVAEGELVFRGTTPAVPKVIIGTNANNKKDVGVGVPTRAYSGETPTAASLVVDHASVQANFLYFGCAISKDVSFLSEPSIVITNGGALVASVYPASSQTDIAGVRVFADNGVLSTSSDWNMRDSATVTNFYTFVNGSQWQVGAYRVASHGSMIAGFTNSQWISVYDPADRSKWKGFDIAAYGMNEKCVVDVSFVHSLFGCNLMEFTAPKNYQSFPFRLAFDDTEWYAGDDDRTLPTGSLNVQTTVSGGGLVLQPPTGRTWTWILPITGDGGIVKGGAGTLVFARHVKGHVEQADPATLCCTGTNVVREGVLKITDGALAADCGRFDTEAAGTVDFDGAAVTNVVLSGSGTFRNGTLVKPTVAAKAGEAPLLDFANGLDATGKVVIGFGEVSETALGTEVAVARFSGAIPSGVTFRAKGRTAGGASVGGTARCAEGVIYATPQVRGLTVIIR